MRFMRDAIKVSSEDRPSLTFRRHIATKFQTENFEHVYDAIISEKAHLQCSIEQ